MDDTDLYADVTEHDGQTWDNDVFELFFKPAEDKPGYYEFQVNAANTAKMDMFIPQQGSSGFLRLSASTAISTLRRRLNVAAHSTTGATKTLAGPSRGASPGPISCGPAVDPSSTSAGSSLCVATITRSSSKGPISRLALPVVEAEFSSLRGLCHATIRRTRFEDSGSALWRREAGAVDHVARGRFARSSASVSSPPGVSEFESQFPDLCHQRTGKRSADDDHARPLVWAGESRAHERCGRYRQF